MTILLLLGLGQEPGLLDDPDWRRSLRERGLSATLGWTGEVIANVHGGLDEELTSAMLLDVIVEADLETLLGWTGGSALFNPIWAEGGGLTRRDVGDLSVVSNIDAPDGVRAYELWVEQAAFDALLSVRAGLLALDTEFALASRAPVFVNGSFGGPPIMTVNMPTPAYPFGFVGGRLRVQPTPELYAMAAVYEGDAGDERENRYGVRFRHPDGEGLLGVVEAGYASERVALRVGGFLHTGGFAEAGSGAVERGIAGGYALVDGPLPGEHGLGGFVRAGFAQEERALAVWTVDAGLTWTGPWPGRDDDVLALGLIWIEISDDFRRAQAPAAYDREIVVELTYRISVTPGFALQPDVQYVRHPGGTSDVDDARVLALRADLVF